MSSGHLKRLVAPRSWNIARKERTWTTKPMPGKHSLEGALPISTILRDYLKVCDNNREAKIILHNGEVLIDQRVVRKPKSPVGLMDVISLPKIKMHVRAMLDKHGRIEFVPIKATEAKWKLVRVENKRNVKGGHVQINLHDGTNILSKEEVKNLSRFAKSFNLQVILEIHSEDELSYICDFIDVVGVNNRNLKKIIVMKLRFIYGIVLVQIDLDP